MFEKVYDRRQVMAKKSHWRPLPYIQISLYLWLTGFFLKFYAKKRGSGGHVKLVLPPSTFQSGKDDCPQLLRSSSGINGVSEFMPVRSFSGVCVAQIFCVFVIYCQPLHICLFVLLNLYIYMRALAHLKIIWQFHAHPVHQKVLRFFGPRYIGDDFF
jgi:hypothetical protein